MKDIKLYQEGEKLKENELLCKVIQRVDYNNQPIYPPIGFLTKLTQKNKIPKSLKDWGGRWEDSPIFVIEEEYSINWKVEGYRRGASQTWGVLIHPKGFTVEIYLSNLMEIIKDNYIINGVISGEWKWDNYKLIKKHE